MTSRHYLTALVVVAACGGNHSDPDDSDDGTEASDDGTPDPDDTETSDEVTRLACTVTRDCSKRGGECVDGVCRADNECASDADCGGSACLPDENFGGLCATSTYGPPVPGPAWSCSVGLDCPAGQGCGNDGLCHEDGECTGLGVGCADGQLCYTPTPAHTEGICSSERPGADPYCRSDGEGACRYECYPDGSCAVGWWTCVDGFCRDEAECASSDDCGPNHVCVENVGYGYSLCEPEEDPDCVDDGTGVCRWECVVDADCTIGGGCAADGFCHGSNECAADADCPPGESCHADAHFGGLCGVPH
jgi:hypothetical protein